MQITLHRTNQKYVYILKILQADYLLCIITTIRKEINQFQTNARFLYPAWSISKLVVFLCFHEVYGTCYPEVGLFSQRSIFFILLFFLLSNILREEKFTKEVSAEEIFAKFIFEIYHLIRQSLFCEK